MSEAAHDFLDPLGFSFGIMRDKCLDRFCVPRFEEWSSGLTSFSPNAALPKSIVTHREHFSLLVEEDDVIYSTSDLLNIFQVSDQQWLLINHELAPDLGSGLASE